MTGDRTTWILGGLAAALFVVAVVVRGIEGDAFATQRPVPPEPGAVASPMQLLARAGAVRLAELEKDVSVERRTAWRDALRALRAIEDCPELDAWLALDEGQRFERLFTGLSSGGKREALGALALVFQLAAVTDWDPGIGSGAARAERLGDLLQEWLTAWGERAARDAELGEPALAAVLLYARAMQAAYDDGWFGDSRRSLERARAFLGALVASPSGMRTALGTALEARHPGALPRELQGNDFLEELADEAALAFPLLDGECGD